MTSSVKLAKKSDDCSKRRGREGERGGEGGGVARRLVAVKKKPKGL